MNKTIKVILAIGMVFSLNGCIDFDKDGEYIGSDLEKLHIQNLSGYEVISYAEYNGNSNALDLHFCKKNKFIINQINNVGGTRVERKEFIVLI